MTELRLHPADVRKEEIALLIRDGHEQANGALRTALAQVSTVHAVATHIAEHEAWDLLAVRFSFLLDVRRALVREVAHTDFIAAVKRAYGLFDVMLVRLLELAGSQVAALLVSPGARGRGVLVAAGPDIARDDIVHGATILDLGPTIFAIFGLSAAADGRVIDRLFATAPAPLAPAPVVQARPLESDPAAHLLALGYADQLSEAQRQVIAETEIAAQCNVIESLLARSQWKMAVAYLEALIERAPSDYESTRLLCCCRMMLGNIQGARPLAQAAIAAEPQSAASNLLIGALFAVEGNYDAAAPYLDRAYARGAGDSIALLRIGWTNLLLRQWSAASDAFAAALTSGNVTADMHCGHGIALQGEGHLDEAEAALRSSIRLSSFNPLAHFHLGQVLALRGNPLDATAALRTAVEQNPLFDSAKQLLDDAKRAVISELIARALEAPDRSSSSEMADNSAISPDPTS